MTTTIPDVKATNTEVGDSAVRHEFAALNIEEKVFVQVVYTPEAVAGNEVRYKIGSEETVVVKAEELTDYYGYKVLVIPFPPAFMRTEFTVALYNSTTGEQVSTQIKATVQGYAATLLNSDSRDLVIAMMRYCDAVLAIK